MIGSQLFSFTSDRNRLAAQTVVLMALLLVRALMKVVANASGAMGYEYAGYFIFYVAGTYALSYIFFLTIPAEERHLYHSTLPNKKIIKTTIYIALLCLAIAIAEEYFCFDGVPHLPSQQLKNIIIFTIGFPINLMFHIVYQFFMSGGLLEESLFRGFFWGYLKKFRFSDFSILCIAAILFWAGHYYYIDLPGRWISVLIGGLVYGAVAWKTRSFFAAALVHACVNNCVMFFRHME
jgi:membrane protease YdiL (CAAX protease family)